VLLLGDPSTAKSQFLKLAQLTAPISVYTSGKGSSAAGLTASVVKDSSTGEFYLEGGAMVQGDGGVVCIDEFDKMREEDRVAIHEAMEQQTISIAKAGINTVLNSRTSVLAAANPPAGRYDDLKSTADNIDLQTTILSRFDLIFIVRDERNFERDMSIARHVVDVHRTSAASNARQRQSGQQQQQQKSAQSNQQQACDGSSIDLKRFVQYAKKHYKPRLTAQAAQHLQQEYVKIRRDMRKRSQSEQHEREDIQRTMPGRQQQQQQQPGDTVIPITVRQLEAIVRISEAFARLSLQSEATQEHVDAALQLFRVSTMDAASSGVVEAPLSDEQKQELQSVESRIRQRVPIGGSIGSKQLKEDLLRLGVNEWAIERATRTMMESKVLEVVGERQRIKRIGA
jgi:DNA replication licensing factor MCM5